MCGRFTLTHSSIELARLFEIEHLDDFPPRYNIAPGQPIQIIIGGSDDRPDAHCAGRHGMLVRWGLIPGWCKDLSGLPLLFNARCETAATRNSFKAAMHYRRCLVPASGFYEWHKGSDGQSTPYFIKPADGKPVAFAGVMESWLGADGSEIDTGAILTRPASGDLRKIHPRAPVPLRGDDVDRWLNCREFRPSDVEDVFQRPDSGMFECVPVSDLVNSVANMSPEVQRPVARPQKSQTHQTSFDFD
ncbi:SOS response-associated peptidase [Aureimonas fodinaquatilis]|uniref:Abasic site processing protein n=1 Tax=Aureimonas fodinaquatilis TaxID=2565783 RepID=A0A5B0DZ40_9HYPH|nr:SOS response-associated peptidase [Aureimonas fodinaquatilis]KAA0971021.1 SOS response-associated peptidase [Aureimonas fodinaquatilis]